MITRTMNKLARLKIPAMGLCLVAAWPSCGKADRNKEPSPPEISGPVAFHVELPRERESPLLSVADYGAAPESSPEANVRGFQNAINAARDTKAAGVMVPHGTYLLRKEAASQLEFHDLKDFTFDGQGSELVFLDHKIGRRGEYLSIRNCERFRMTDVTLEWDWKNKPLSTIGTIIAVNPAESEIEYEIHGREIPTAQAIIGGREWDSTIGNRSPRGFALPDNTIVKTTGNVIRLKLTKKSSISAAKVGQQSNLRFGTNYMANAIDVEGCRHAVFDQVNIHGAPYVGVNANLNEYLKISGCRIEPRPGSGRSKSVHAAFEIHNSFGYFILEDNVVRFNHDDGLHYSDYYLGGGLIATESRHTLIADRLQFYAAGGVVRIGDRMEMRKADFSPAAWSSEIVDFEWQKNHHPGQPASNRCVITFKDPLPDSVPTDGFLVNRAFGKGQYIIRGNTFENGMCHGITVSLPNGLIENNKVTASGYAGLVVRMVSRWKRWFMGTFPENLIVRNNVFQACNTARMDPSALFVGAGYDPNEKQGFAPAAYPVLRNILIENNRIEDTPWAAIGILSASNVVVRDNRIVNSNTDPCPTKYPGSIFVAVSDHIVLQANTNGKGDFSNHERIHIDPATTSSVVIMPTSKP